MSSNLIIVLTVLLLLAIAGAGSMIWAYVGSGSLAVLFQEVISAPKHLSPQTLQLFQTGIGTYVRQRYRTAIDQFTQVIQEESTCAAAYHNRGLALANLNQDDQATTNLIKAAELYLSQGDQASAGLVKQHLVALKVRSRDRQNLKP
jgi:tetratricopeptide (TPR) repeat protein